jgi:hypothetical protein
MKSLPPLKWPSDGNSRALTVCFALTWFAMVAVAIATWSLRPLAGEGLSDFLLALACWAVSLAFVTFMAVWGSFVPFTLWLLLRWMAREIALGLRGR